MVDFQHGCGFVHGFVRSTSVGLFTGLWRGCGFVGFSRRDQCGQGSSSGCGGEIGVVKDLVVVVVLRSAWLWVSKSDLVVCGDGFTNRFWP